MRGSRWSEQKLTEALEALALNSNRRAVGRAVGVPESTIRRWANVYGTQVEAIKRRNEKIRSRVAEESIEEMAKRHAEAGRSLADKGLDLLTTIRRTTAQGAARLVVAGVELERLASGEATQRQEITVWDRIDKLIEEEKQEKARKSKKATLETMR